MPFRLRAAASAFVLAFLMPGWPVSAAAESSEPPRSEETILYPRRSGETATVREERGSVRSSTWAALGFLLVAGGAWLLIKRRQGAPLGLRGQERRLRVEETHSLGNRQYLVVAGYENRRFLLGVCPGRIELLSRLDASAAPTPSAEEKS